MSSTMQTSAWAFRRRRRVNVFLYVAIFLLLCADIARAFEKSTPTQLYDGPASIDSYHIVQSPQEAYERALLLLRSTLVVPSGTAKIPRDTRQGGKGDSFQRGGLMSVSDFVRVKWNIFLSWSPLAGLQRAFRRLDEIARSYTPFRTIVGGSASKIAASLKRRKNSWEGSSLVTASQSFALGKDPVEEEHARRYSGARREEIWPEWDGGDDVFFGPFHSTVVDESNLKIKGTSKVEETFNSMVGSKVQAMKEKASKATGTNKRQKFAERRLQADVKRAEAIALLTWAAGWGDAEAIQNEATLLALPSSVNWRDEAAKGALVGAHSSKTYLDHFFASTLASKLYNNNISRPHADALWVLGIHSLWGTHGTTPKPARAKACFERLVGLNGNASAHNKLAWLEGGAWGKEGWNLMGVNEVAIGFDQEDRQAKALMHYTAAAEAGETSAQNALAYRYQAGIGVAQNCGAALYWYEKVAEDAHQRFLSGPPGGLTLPYTHLRLSDIAGGVYGPGSSAASTGKAQYRPAIQAALNSLPSDGSSDGRRLEDLLEFFTYHAERGSPSFALKLAKIYYDGSVLGYSESAARVQRDYAKARRYLLKITQEVWPTDSRLVRRGGPQRMAKKGEKGEDVKLQVDDATAIHAGIAAGMIGKMWLRGDGVPQNFHRAWVWFQRGKDQGDAESFNGLGVMYKNGLDIPKDNRKAAEYFEAAATGHNSAGCINIAKIYLDMGDFASAAKWFDMALKIGNSFEAYYYLALINTRTSFFVKDTIKKEYLVGPPGTPSYERCRNAVNGYKYVAERGDWKDDTFTRAEKAWNKGFPAKALLGWAMAGEKGFEAAQNNLAWVLDRDKKRLRINLIDAPENNATDRLALIHWIRSAAQDNVDALVKMGDYYYHGLGLGEQTSKDHWHSSPTTSKGSHFPVVTASYDKAAACYSSAAEKQTSALAYWNMGYLYENGLGVSKKDYNLAKRYYDMALELNPQEAHLPIFLSLGKLFLMAFWDALAHKDASALSLLNSLTFGNGGMQSNLLGTNVAGPYTEADEIRLKKEAEEMALEDSRTEEFDEEDKREALADPNLPETYLDIGHRQSKRLEEDDKSMEEEEDIDDDTIEGLMIVLGLAALAWLVYARQGAQMRLERMRRENQGAAAAAANPEEAAIVPPPVVDPNQPFGWPLQDGNAYAGL